MAKFVPLTLMSKTQKVTLYLNMDQVRYLRPQTSGGTTIYFVISVTNKPSWSKKMRPRSPTWCGADNSCLGIWVMTGREFPSVSQSQYPDFSKRNGRSAAKLLTKDEARRIRDPSGRSHTCAALAPSQGIHCDRSRNRRSPGTGGIAPVLATLSCSLVAS